MKVFLGGTVNGSKWRNRVKEELVIDYFDPVVDVWNDAAYERELSERRNCDFVLFVLTPRMTGYYAIAEVADDSFLRPDNTIYCYLPEDDGERFTDERIEEFEYLGRTVLKNGGLWLKNIDEVISYLNQSISIDDFAEVAHYDAYISFGKRQSSDFTNKLSNRLSEFGYLVFHDVNDIPIIFENEELIYKHILNSDNFIYVISPNAIHSKNSKKELDFAIKYKKRIIPILHQELSKESDQLDEIIAKKNHIIFKRDDIELIDIAEKVRLVIEDDKGYVQQHSNILFKAQSWEKNGKRQKDLLFGEERKQAVKWMESASEVILPLEIHLDYIKASKSLSGLMLMLLWLDSKTSSLTRLNWFTKLTLFVGLISPAAMAVQWYELQGKNKEDVEGVSEVTWTLFLIVQVAVLFEAIKNKDISAFLRMLLSMIFTTGIIITLIILKR